MLALDVAFCSVLAIVTRTDLDRRIVPNEVLGGGAIAALAIAGFSDPASLPERLAAATATGGALVPIAIAYPAGLGMGDAKLAAVMGLYLGRAIAPALLVASASGALAGAILLARHGAAARKRPIPFAPFLALGGLVGLAAGDEAVRWYSTSLLSLH